jgi:predicted ATPase/class 3 adenylate cyclase
VRAELPTGTVTFVFTDVEGSTSLLNELGGETYADALADHRRVIREACTRHGGVEVDTQGDAFFFAFPTAPSALAAASDFTEGLARNGRIRVRVGVHTGTPLLGEEGYVGHDVHRAARIAAAGYGGQVLVSSSTASLVDTELTDLGEHRFKDLAATDRVFQLGGGEFPALRSLYQTNLPIPPTAFLGRECELAEVTSLLTREDSRLVTLTGPGGTGKTRLALEAASRSAGSFPDGIYWVGLAPLRDASLLAATFVQALELVEQPDRTLTESIVSALADTRMLLVVDNCEHLLDAVADFISDLIDACPQLVVACSSRERLRLRAERVFPVPPLASSDAEALFAERARAVEPTFLPDEHVGPICEALDELPLAIELAAARVRLLSTAALRERLAERLSLLRSRDRDVDERQRTLEATIAWSYDLLDPEEQRVLRVLSVFAGGCTLEAAQKVADADLDPLEALLDKSLLRHRIDEAGGDRYWMLETIREYGVARLDESGEGGIARARHRDYYSALAPYLGGDSLDPPLEHMARYAADRGNFRVVFTEALARKDGAVATNLVASLVGIWLSAGEVVDSYEPARAALALPGADDGARGWALERVGVIAYDLGRWEEAQNLYVAALESARDRGDTLLACEASRHLAPVFRVMGDSEQALEWAQRSVDFARELGSELAEVKCLGTQVELMSAVAMDNPVVDAAALERCLAVARELAPRAMALGRGWEVDEVLRNILFHLDRYVEALPHAQALVRHFGATSVRRVGNGLWNIGLIFGGLGDYQTGVRLVTAGRRIDDEQGLALDATDHLRLERFETRARQALAADVYEGLARAGEALSIEEGIELALSYERSGVAAATANHAVPH